MNYLSEIVAFTEWKEVNQLPASAIALWYELMAICNKTGWQQEFTVPNGLLQIKAGLSRKEFDRARQLLIQAGRINYKKSNRVNQAGKYEIIPFVQKGQQEGQQQGKQEGQQEGQRTAHSGGNERGTLFKLKQNETNYKDDDKSSSGDGPPNNQQLIAELVEKYREIPGVTPNKGDYPFIGRLYNEEGYDKVLEAIEKLNWVLKTKKIESTLLYLKGILKPKVKGESAKVCNLPDAREMFGDVEA
ncbi:hypothetical protein [Desulfoscipio geothermicus]|uniref:Uncharacterized protein n=1 Tax=Desulfoscipio geothermicus DSM 3669 TaxID=1121426 RepID=A0A1I6ECJ0_9FIRM|nr:hypothetical protein [Desulfoscipio geothermicus]SFR15357.1 hypothetical protein SAMN05660706_13532 [Desulfoscipio geothermicus DSM 3669]